MKTLTETNVPDVPCQRGKVRDVYDLGDRLVLIATDRISAFDYVLPTGIPDKGRVLTSLTLYWLNFLNVPNHLISTKVADFGAPFTEHEQELQGRSMLVTKTEVVPIECVVRGWLIGSGWKDYQANGSVCGIELPAGLQQAQQLPEPIFTPATKATSGHDENVSFEKMVDVTGQEIAEDLRQRSIEIYRTAAKRAQECGLILADTKFEWGKLPDGKFILIDEVLTPDSSRYWPADQHRLGISPPSFDKQFVRDWLLSTDWDRNSPPPELPEDVVLKTREKYFEAHRRLTGSEELLC